MTVIVYFNRLKERIVSMVAHCREYVKQAIIALNAIAVRIGASASLTRTEVNMWLRASDEPWQSWCALDDQPWLYRPFNDRVVLCDPGAALTEVALARLSALVADRA
jgi:hypothetical protein